MPYCWPRDMVLFRQNIPAGEFDLYLSTLECKPSNMVAISFPCCVADTCRRTCWLFRNRSRAPLAAFLFFTAMLFPVLGFFNVYPFKFSFVADHFQYLACIGPIALLTAGTESAFVLLKGNQQRFIKPVIYIIIQWCLVC